MEVALFIDFKQLREKVSFEQVLSWRNIPVKEYGHDLKGACPICASDGNGRAFTDNKDKGLFYCFGDCRSGGDIIQFIAPRDRVQPKVAAALIAEHFLTERVAHHPHPPNRNKLAKVAEYIDPSHPL